MFKRKASNLAPNKGHAALRQNIIAAREGNRHGGSERQALPSPTHDVTDRTPAGTWCVDEIGGGAVLQAICTTSETRTRLAQRSTGPILYQAAGASGRAGARRRRCTGAVAFGS